MTQTTTPQSPLDVRARQDPLRARYRSVPEEAMITDGGHTESHDLGDPWHVSAVPGAQDYGHRWHVGLHRAVGGFHDAPNPGDLLCTALATCMDSVIRLVASRHGVVLEYLDVTVVGHVDVRGTLVVSRDVPVGFQSMECRVRLRTADGTDPALVQRLLAGAEHSCVNLQTLRSGVPVEVQAEVG